MKLSKILMFSALFALTACGGGKGAEVDQAKAKEVAKNISTETKNVKNLEFTMEMSMYDAEDKDTSISKYTYRFNDNGEIYANVYGSDSDGRSDVSFYQVKNDEYEEVIYYHTLSHTNKDNKDDESTVCYGKKGNETVYATVSASVGTSAIMSVNAVYTASNDPLVILSDAEKEADAGYVVKYYSSGDKNLTIEVKYDGSKVSSSSEEENVKSAVATYTYTNGLFSKLEYSTEYTNGNKMSAKAEAKYGSVKISLPNGWKDIVNKASFTL